jgi:hypothetical protein
MLAEDSHGQSLARSNWNSRMMKPAMATTLAGLTILAALSACSKEPADPPVASGSDLPIPAISEPASSASPTASAPAASGSTIPVAAQGRWGLVPNDCTSKLGDNKGLITISPTSIRFYESTGKLGAIAERSDTRIRAAFAFTGEGMEWSHDMILDVKDAGRTLVRRDYGEDAAPGPFQYAKCEVPAS